MLAFPRLHFEIGLSALSFHPSFAEGGQSMKRMRSILIYLWQNNFAQNDSLNRLLESQSSDDIEAFWAAKRRILPELDSLDDAIDKAKAVEFQIHSMGAQLFTSLDETYPQPLRRISPIPHVVAIDGNPAILQSPQVSVVGSREMLEVANDIERAIVEELISRGFTITSGGAIGIDAVAHRCAMRLGAPTIVISPGGIQNPGPKQNGDIFDYARKYGAILSQFPDSFAPIRRNFPKRNKIIAALSDATVLIQCRIKSGALYTAHEALRLGKPLFVAAMRGFHPLSEGGLQLVKQQKAKLVSEIADIDIFPHTPMQKSLFSSNAFSTSPDEALKQEQNANSAPNTLSNAVLNSDLPAQFHSQNATANTPSPIPPKNRNSPSIPVDATLSTHEGIRFILSQKPSTRETLRQSLHFPSDFDETILDMELNNDISIHSGFYHLV